MCASVAVGLCVRVYAMGLCVRVWRWGSVFMCACVHECIWGGG